jgi:hypothetical protein
MWLLAANFIRGVDRPMKTDYEGAFKTAKQEAADLNRTDIVYFLRDVETRFMKEDVSPTGAGSSLETEEPEKKPEDAIG